MALGAYTHPDGLNSDKAQRQLITGKQLAYTCYQMLVHMDSIPASTLGCLIKTIHHPYTHHYFSGTPVASMVCHQSM